MNAKTSLAVAALATTFVLSCTEPEKTDPPADGAITLLEPRAGKSFKVTDTIPIIAQCDYTKFASGLNIKFSNDSSKSWIPVKSLVRKEGMDKDTLRWEPGVDRDLDLKAGMRILLQISDYDKKYIVTSGYITITP